MSSCADRGGGGVAVQEREKTKLEKEERILLDERENRQNGKREPHGENKMNHNSIKKYIYIV